MKFIKYEECKISKYATLIRGIPHGGSMLVEILADELEAVAADLFLAAELINAEIKIDKFCEANTYKVTSVYKSSAEKLKERIIKILSKECLTHGILVNRLRPERNDDIESAIINLLSSGQIECQQAKRWKYKYSVTAQ